MNHRVIERDRAIRALRDALGYRVSARDAQGYWLMWYAVFAVPVTPAQPWQKFTSNTGVLREHAA